MKKLLMILVIALLLPSTVYAADTYISDTAYAACVQYGEKYGICPELLMAIAEHESSGRSDAENNDCKGLMQIDVKFHAGRMKRLGVEDIFDEAGSIHVGTDYLSELFGKYDDVYMVLMCYSMGEARAQSLFKQCIYESGYAAEICERSAELERLHGK